MALFNSIVFFLVFFLLGVLCVLIPFLGFKQKIIKLIKSKLSSETPIRLDPGDAISQLTYYIEQTKSRIKKQSNQILILSKKLESIVSQIKEALIILDERGYLLFQNPQSQELFAFEDKFPVSYVSQTLEKSSKSHPSSLNHKEEALPAHHPLSINEITRLPDVMNVFEQCLKTEKVIIKECVFSKKNQYLKSVFQVTALPVIHKELKIKNVILLFYDQTDIKESRQAHIDFVSNVSHELKTPLTSIQGYVEMLQDDFSQKKLDQFENFLKILLKNCKRMSHLIDDLLSLSNLSSQAHLEKKRISTKEITHQVLAQINPGSHTLHYFFTTPYVMANPTWLEMVLYNLIDNACRHTPANCDIYIRWEKTRDRVLLKVIDTGKGISEKYRERIFERFFRVDPARSREKGGTGVGLALVKQSMEKHGGSVRAVSSSKGGMEFICEFPDD